MNNLLEKSVQQYRQLYELTRALERPLQSMDSASIAKLTGMIEETKQQAAALDREINQLSGAAKDTPRNHHRLLEERRAIMEKIIDKNKELTPKIQAMMALIKSDLAAIRHGMQSIGHYAQAPKPHGRIINTSN